MKKYSQFLKDKQKIIFIRDNYTKEFKDLEDRGSEIFEYIWVKDESFDKIIKLKNKVIWYRGPIEDEKWVSLINDISKNNIVLNSPEKCLQVASKVKFYRDNKDFKYLPKVWFNPKDIEFPCVQKPDNSFSGKGVFVVNKLSDVDTKSGDLWMEKINFDSEWRIWLYKNKILGTFWRKHNINIQDKKTFDKVDFDYLERDLPSNNEQVNEIIEYIYKKYKLDFSAIDLFYKKGQWFLCEVNSQPGYYPTVWDKLINKLKKVFKEIL